jgi:hypothetical protein
MGLLKLRKNKKYSYTPRYYQTDKEGSPFKMEPMFNGYRKTVGNQGGLKAKFFAAIDDFKSQSDARSNRTVLVIMGVLILLFLIIIDFDLSIFKPQ